MNELNIILLAGAAVSLALSSYTIWREWQRARLERRWQNIIAQYVRYTDEDGQP